MVARCCVPYCKSNSKKVKVSFHEFPVNMDLRNAWLKAIARKDFLPNDKSNSSQVCGFHFKDSDFMPYRKKRCLKKDAVPSIFKSYPSYLTSQKSYERVIKIKLEDSNSIPNEQVKVTSFPDSVYNANKQATVTSTSSDQTETSNLIMLAESCDATSQLDPERVKSKTTESQTKIDPETEKSVKNTQTKVGSSILLSKSAELKRLQRLLVHRNKKIESLQKNLEDNSKITEYLERNVIAQKVEKMQALYNEGYASNQVEFILTQISSFGKTKPRWPDTVLRECVLLHASSPKCYEEIQKRQLFLLPSAKTLHRFVEKKNTSPGFSGEE